MVLPKPAGADDEADAWHRGRFAVQTLVQPLDQAGAVAGFLLLVINGIPLGFTEAVTVALHIETLNMPD